MCFNWDSSRLIAQMKKSHSCCCTTLRARTVHHSSVTTINIQFVLDRAWVLKLYLMSCLLQPLTLLLSRVEVCSVLSTCMRGEIQPKVMFQGGKISAGGLGDVPDAPHEGKELLGLHWAGMQGKGKECKAKMEQTKRTFEFWFTAWHCSCGRVRKKRQQGRRGEWDWLWIPQIAKLLPQ